MTEIILIFVIAICIFGLYREITNAGRWDSKKTNHEFRERRKKKAKIERQKKEKKETHWEY